MKDFFGVMGKAFAVVFGSTSALALVVVLLVLAMRPVMRSWVREVPVNMQVEKPSVAPSDWVDVVPKVPKQGKITSHDEWEKYRAYKRGECVQWDLNGKCTMTYNALQLGNCDKSGCSVYRNDFVVGSLSRDEITKAQWTPVDQGEHGPWEDYQHRK